MRDLHEQLRIKQFWRSMSTPDDREAVWERLGTKFFPFDRMPGWHASLASPVDAMHNIFLGMTSWIVGRIIVGPGLLDYRHPRDSSRRSPVQRWNNCVKSAWFPARYTRLPPLVCSFFLCKSIKFTVCLAWIYAWGLESRSMELDW